VGSNETTVDYRRSTRVSGAVGFQLQFARRIPPAKSYESRVFRDVPRHGRTGVPSPRPPTNGRAPEPRNKYLARASSFCSPVGVPPAARELADAVRLIFVRLDVERYAFINTDGTSRMFTCGVVSGSL
jgi:hypothetical protein